MKNKILNKIKISFIAFLIITALFCFFYITISSVYCFSLAIDSLHITLQNIQIDSFSEITLNNTDAINEPLNTGVPSVKCPTCASEGIEVWVIYGKCCPRCGTACD